MNCDEIKNLLDDYYDGILDEKTKDEFEKGLENCEDQKNELLNLYSLSKEIASLPLSFDPPKEIITELTSRLMEISVEVASNIDTEEIQKITKKSSFNEKKSDHKHSQNKQSYIYRKSIINKFSILLTLCIIIIGGIAYYSFSYFNDNSPWKIQNLKGSLNINDLKIMKSDLLNGDIVETKGNSQLTIQIPDEGTISLEPNTRIKILSTTPTDSRIEMFSGSIGFSAMNANSDFYLNYKSLQISQNFSSFRMQIDTNNNVQFNVKDGFIKIQSPRRSVFLSKGYTVKFNPQNNFSLPYNVKSTDSFRSNLEILSFDPKNISALSSLLFGAQKSDALTLIELIKTVTPVNREVIYNKLNSLYPKPQKVEKEKVLSADSESLQIWWEDIQWRY